MYVFKVISVQAIDPKHCVRLLLCHAERSEASSL